MILWLDAHLSPAIAPWLRRRFVLEAIPVRDLDLREAEDTEFFAAARHAGAILITKHSDFVELVQRLGSPPQVIWLRSGNTSNARLKQLLTQAMPTVLEMLRAGRDWGRMVGNRGC